METFWDFPDRMIPTLDFKIGYDINSNKFYHDFFEKPMSSKWVIPECSALDNDQIFQILSNDFCRRLSRIDPSWIETLSNDVIDKYNYKLVYSR